MKASELIKTLQHLVIEHGDLYVEREDYHGDFDIESVEFITNEIFMGEKLPDRFLIG